MRFYGLNHVIFQKKNMKLLKEKQENLGVLKIHLQEKQYIH